MRIAIISMLIGALATLHTAHAEDTPSISDLGWLEGCWRGTAFAGEGAECWVKGADGHLTGLFQYVNDGKLQFTEIMHLAEFEDGPALRVKHFHPDITGWEEKGDFISFVLKKTDENSAVFSGLSFELEDNTRLIIKLRMRGPDGETRIETMIFDRIP